MPQTVSESILKARPQQPPPKSDQGPLAFQAGCSLLPPPRLSQWIIETAALVPSLLVCEKPTTCQKTKFSIRGPVCIWGHRSLGSWDLIKFVVSE